MEFFQVYSRKNKHFLYFFLDIPIYFQFLKGFFKYIKLKNCRLFCYNKAKIYFEVFYKKILFFLKKKF